MKHIRQIILEELKYSLEEFLDSRMENSSPIVEFKWFKFHNGDNGAKIISHSGKFNFNQAISMNRAEAFETLNDIKALPVVFAISDERLHKIGSYEELTQMLNDKSMRYNGRYILADTWLEEAIVNELKHAYNKYDTCLISGADGIVIFLAAEDHSLLNDKPWEDLAKLLRNQRY